ncbi:cupredoxin domain-containing protein [Nanoarchaeota archaeon]
MKYVILILAILFTALLLTGCGQETELEGEDIVFEPVENDTDDTTDDTETDPEADLDDEEDELDEEDAEEEEESELAENETETDVLNETETEPEETETTAKIIIEDIGYTPKEITVAPGTTVIWEHKDMYEGRTNIKHMVSILSNEKSDMMMYGDTFNFTFVEPGEYSFIDVIYKASMRGKIIVE